MPPKVLMVDDEEELAQATTEYLTLCGIKASYVTDAEAAQEVTSTESPDLILLDINLPGASGFEFCRSLRERSSDVMILFLSARDSDSDQILALSLGGDDYMRKPFSMAVLLAKIRRMLERASASQPSGRTGFQDAWLIIDLSASRVWAGGTEVPMPATEYRLLSMLVENQGRVVTKQEFLDEVWDGSFVSEGTLSVHIRRLRTRIEPDPDKPTYVRTVWGRGYLFAQPGT